MCVSTWIHWSVNQSISGVYVTHVRPSSPLPPRPAYCRPIHWYHYSMHPLIAGLLCIVISPSGLIVGYFYRRRLSHPPPWFFDRLINHNGSDLLWKSLEDPEVGRPLTTFRSFCMCSNHKNDTWFKNCVVTSRRMELVSWKGWKHIFQGG